VPAQQSARHWRQNTELIALRVTDNASRHGEHYITETPLGVLADGAVGDDRRFVIAFMACLKILLAKAQMPPLTGAITFCLNYGLGFCLIHILHGTVATKQPAMTANAIAAEHQRGRRQAAQRSTALATLIARTCRSQIVAILGNVGVAIPWPRCSPWPSSPSAASTSRARRKSQHLLSEQSLIHGGAVFYAAIAGVCLFISGLISGYYDNYAAYNRIPERIVQLAGHDGCSAKRACSASPPTSATTSGPSPATCSSAFCSAARRCSGLLVGLPLDIRHVAFSSAFVGIAFVDLELLAGSLALLLGRSSASPRSASSTSR
jgi:site-specific recombinase